MQDKIVSISETMKMLEDLGVPSENIEDIDLILRHSRTIAGVGEDGYQHTMSAAEISALHEVIMCGIGSQEPENISDVTKRAVKSFRDFCRFVWVQRGLTSEEAERVDTLRAREKYWEEPVISGSDR